ncbi:ABC transporter substrate-binding protein [Belnapia rosea]|uniref:NitT/TauT family transport system substrate-binding protein n=1 Tax=Belnapia rosea TaxID=938405 RepID=A0A1G6LA47_9PROT|nr:ABC transporter substrate-binding protein [Belnapia rosea]SDC39436.1 NitT/TauT family transport system substrate-binding protein [Belnapia rosea]
MQPLTLIEPFRALFYAPFYLAEAEGLFAREGIDLRMVTAGSTDAAAAMLLAGKADLAWSGPMRPLLLRSRDPGCTLRSFCAVVMRDPFLLVGAAPRPGFVLEELPGLRLGLVSEVPTPVWCLRGDLAQAGIDPMAIGEPAGPGMAENAGAVVAGALDVAQLFEPFACRVEDAGGAVWHAQANRGLTAYTAFYATEAGIAARRPALIGMVRAMRAALARIRQAPAEAVAAAIASRFPEVPEAHRVRAIARYQALGLWEAGPAFPRKAFDRLGAAMLAAGAIAHVPPFEDCVDTALEAEALA